MSTNRSRRIDHDTAEQLLGGAGAGTAVGHDALAGLIAAAAAPAADGELPGEQAALAAFRAARLAPVPPSRKRPMLTSAVLRLLSAKVVAAALATALGGVAVAAATGNMPAALGGRPVRSGPAATASAGAPGRSPSATVTGSAAAVPSELAALCRVLAVSGGSNPGTVLAEHRFAALVAAAGGQAEVPGYCAPVLAGHGSGQSDAPGTKPTVDRPGTVPTGPGAPGAGHRPGDPGAGHGGGQGSHPTGRPSTAPNPPRKGDPSPHRTGRPQ
ncbi:hypothetical protein [Streptacidiphilus sp. EB129]|uniref:hypothetical protein n=1 Tax=Streptacidiphilus sp. EB129 TaxID=3156262 RepID=UPI0035165DCD